MKYMSCIHICTCKRMHCDILVLQQGWLFSQHVLRMRKSVESVCDLIQCNVIPEILGVHLFGFPLFGFLAGMISTSQMNCRNLKSDTWAVSICDRCVKGPRQLESGMRLRFLTSRITISRNMISGYDICPKHFAWTSCEFSAKCSQLGLFSPGI